MEKETEEKKSIRLLRADEIECRISTINEKGLSILLYKDARVDQRILDESFTPFGWRRSHQCIDGNLYCTVEIWDEKKQQWIAKQDVGTTSYAEKEKGQASDSFKRACFNWGVGRELYTAPFIWIPSAKVNIQKRGERYVTPEHFQVQKIAYNEQREIEALVITNGRGESVFEMKRAMPITDEMITALKKELKRTGVSIDAVLDRYGVQKMEEMTPEIYKKALNSLRKTKSKDSEKAA